MQVMQSSNMKPHFLKNSNGEPEWAIIPFEEYLALRKNTMLLKRTQSNTDLDDRFIPKEVARSLAKGEHPIRAWRKYRGLTQKQLGESVGIGKVYMSQIELGVRFGQMNIISKMADVLGVTLDDLKVEEER